MPDSPERDAASSDLGSEDDPDDLSWWERRIAFTLGFLAASAGGYSVFVSDNQAGSTAMIVLGAAFLLMGVQGTPISEFGKDAIKADRRKGRRRVEQKFEQKLKEAGPEEAQVFLEGAAARDPELARSVEVQDLRWRLYESQAFRELAEILDTRYHNMFHIGRDYVADGREFDVVLSSQARPDSKIYIDFKVFKPTNAGLGGLYGAARKFSSLKAPGMLIVDMPMHESAASEYIKRFESASVELVFWQTPLDNDRIVQAIRRIIDKEGADF